MCNHRIKHKTSKDTFIASIDDDNFILCCDNEPDNLYLVGELRNKRDITNALDMMAFLSTFKPISKRDIHIGDGIYDVYITDDGRKYIKMNDRAKIFIGTHESSKEFVSYLIISLLFRLAYLYGIDNTIPSIIKLSSDSNIITIQPHGSVFKYSIIKLTEEVYTLNIIGNTSYNPLITDYQSDGLYECKEVNICTIISQDIVSVDMIERIYLEMK